jgi:hypothetical protein
MKNGEDESIWVTTHIYMEMSQGHSLCSYLKQIKMFFSFLSVTKLENKQAEQALWEGYQWE